MKYKYKILNMIHQVSVYGHNPWVPLCLNITICNIVKV